MKIAKVIPIYKCKEKNEMDNYRPISLLPSISKIIEKLVHKRLYSFCENNDILNDNQYGFRPKHSTIDAVSKFTADIVSSLEKNMTTYAVFLDLSKDLTQLTMIYCFISYAFMVCVVWPWSGSETISRVDLSMYHITGNPHKSAQGGITGLGGQNEQK